MIFLIAVVLEVVNLTLDKKPFANAIFLTIINWSAFVIFAIMSFFIRKALWVQKLVCPFLTIYIFCLVIQSDPSIEMNSAILFAKAIIVMPALLYSLVMFNEGWLLNTGIFAISFALIVSTS